MNEREYDLLTTAPAMQGKRNDSTSGHYDPKSGEETKTKRLRSIARADPLVRK
jgi:hypothetical protein